MLDQEF